MQLAVGISACLLGQKVRYDGGHKASEFCLTQLQPHVRYIAVCPENAIGMGTPRPPIRLQKNKQDEIRLVQVKDSSLDYTDAMQQYSEQVLPGMEQLAGFVVCAKSPSCGMERVRLYNEQGHQLGKAGVGLFTRQLMQRYPWLPVEEDGRLHDEALRENFITRLFACHDYQQLRGEGFSVGKLVEFHSRYKFLVMAHSPIAYRELGRLVAQAKLFDKAELEMRYLHDFMQALQQLSSRKTHANVLQHLQGFFKQQLSSKERQELASLIDRYRQGHLPLMAPLTMLQHHLSRFDNKYLAAQTYLQPYPESLGLRG
ncbi:DUF523 and DUF1722 domain-containing protein [Alkalimonas collagenimarina]|uniref:DUF523 and DUF1722 domain-containing protein n=1 Tax=Alkalimonas collagenimarina TaxID=400390 RepID=A0ABT9H076_9GAMM|nr:DUF523 and DUF1722 domain-containing protein [Alkalimonas collagenimarina]MDP4536721.1 DUF523 and DUF1722 domain-containing protein [Alkalimonas collagenimarina]